MGRLLGVCVLLGLLSVVINEVDSQLPQLTKEQQQQVYVLQTLLKVGVERTFIVTDTVDANLITNITVYNFLLKISSNLFTFTHCNNKDSHESVIILNK